MKFVATVVKVSSFVWPQIELSNLCLDCVTGLSDVYNPSPDKQQYKLFRLTCFYLRIPSIV